MTLINPTTPAKIIQLGAQLGLRPGQHVIDFGCGFGEVLTLWVEHFGISGVGVDIRQYACDRANARIQARGLEKQIEIVCSSGSDYAFADGEFDVAVCLGATFIWGGVAPTLQALARAIDAKDGRIAIGEQYWKTDRVPPVYAQRESAINTEYDLMRIWRTAGFTLTDVITSSQDEWDAYQSANWRGLIAWLKENPQHPERNDVLNHLQTSQNKYFRYQREYIGWALYALTAVV